MCSGDKDKPKGTEERKNKQKKEIDNESKI